MITECLSKVELKEGDSIDTWPTNTPPLSLSWFTHLGLRTNCNGTAVNSQHCKRENKQNILRSICGVQATSNLVFSLLLNYSNRAMSTRMNGSKMVVAAVVATVTALGIGTVYVPFFADKDKLRGMHEDGDGGLSERERREYEKYLAHIQEQRSGSSIPHDDRPPPDRGMPKGNNMWSRINQQATPERK